VNTPAKISRIWLILLLFPLVLPAQEWQKSSPSDYMWKYVGMPGFSQGRAFSINLDISNSGVPYVAFTDNWADYTPVVMKFDNGNWVDVGDVSSVVNSVSFDLSFALSPDDQPYIAFLDVLLDTAKVSVMKFSKGQWEFVGPRGISSGYADYPNIAFNQAGIPHVAFQDKYHLWRASVMKFNGVEWEYIGSPGFTESTSGHISLAFSPADEPHLAFPDESYENKASVMKFNGTVWEYVGSPGFSIATISRTKLIIDESGTPYVGFTDGSAGLNGSVMSYNDTSWSYVGPAGFTGCYINKISLATNQLGQLNAAYCRMGYLPGACVKKFSESSWIFEGEMSFSEGNAGHISLAINSSGVPLVAYSDFAYDGKVTVMKYDSVYVGINEPQNTWFAISPNPASTHITIEAPAKSLFSIVNLHGQELITRQITEPKTRIDISTLPSGVYLVKVTGEQAVKVGKFVKQ